MSLSDPEVAALARQAVDLLDPHIAIEIEPRDGDDPYRFGAGAWVAWPLIDGHRAFGMGVDAGMTPAEALARMIDILSEYSSESSRFWGAAFPGCLPGHVHPSDVDTEADEVMLRCPAAREVVERIRPAL